MYSEATRGFTAAFRRPTEARELVGRGHQRKTQEIIHQPGPEKGERPGESGHSIWAGTCSDSVDRNIFVFRVTGLADKLPPGSLGSS